MREVWEAHGRLCMTSHTSHFTHHTSHVTHHTSHLPSTQRPTVSPAPEAGENLIWMDACRIVTMLPLLKLLMLLLLLMMMTTTIPITAPVSTKPQLPTCNNTNRSQQPHTHLLPCRHCSTGRFNRETQRFGISWYVKCKLTRVF